MHRASIHGHAFHISVFFATGFLFAFFITSSGVFFAASLLFSCFTFFAAFFFLGAGAGTFVTAFLFFTAAWFLAAGFFFTYRALVTALVFFSAFV